MKIMPVRGTHDFFGQQVLKYRAIQDLISHYSSIYNFEEAKYFQTNSEVLSLGSYLNSLFVLCDK